MAYIIFAVFIDGVVSNYTYGTVPITIAASNVVMEPRFLGDPSISVSVAPEGGEAADPTLSGIKLFNGDGALDSVYTDLTAGRQLTLFGGTSLDDDFADLTVLFSGVVNSISLDEDYITITGKTKLSLLDEVIEDELLGDTYFLMPHTFGTVLNITPSLEDPVLLVYRFDEGPANAVNTVYSNRLEMTYLGSGITLSSGIDSSVTTIPVSDASNLPSNGIIKLVSGGNTEWVLYTGKTGNNLTGATRGYASSYDNDGANSHTSGTPVLGGDYIYDLDKGRIILGVNPAGTLITADVEGNVNASGYFHETIECLAQYVLSGVDCTTADGTTTLLYYGNNSEGDIYVAATIGSYLTERISKLDFLDELLTVISGFYGIAPDTEQPFIGQISVTGAVDWVVGGENPDFFMIDAPTIDFHDNIEYLIRHEVGKNWTQMEYTDLAQQYLDTNPTDIDWVLGVPTTVAYGTEGGGAVKTAYPTAQYHGVRQGVFTNSVWPGAVSEMQRYGPIFSTQRYEISLTVQADVNQIKLGDRVKVYYDRYGFSPTGEDMTVIGVTERIFQREVSLELFK